MTYSPGLDGSLGNSVTFDTGFAALTPPATGPSSSTPITINGATFTGTGIVVNGSNPGFYAAPAGDSSNYMAILAGQSETIKYSSLMDAFGLYWGSIDAYNHLTFYNSANPSVKLTISGPDLPAPPAIPFGNQSSSASNEYVTFTGLSGFDTVVILSDQNAFEFDNVVAAAPEASTWAMMILGFLGLGFLGYRRRNTMAFKGA